MKGSLVLTCFKSTSIHIVITKQSEKVFFFFVKTSLKISTHNTKGCLDHIRYWNTFFYVVCEFFSVTSAGLNVNVVSFFNENILNGQENKKITSHPKKNRHSMNSKLERRAKKKKGFRAKWKNSLKRTQNCKNISIKFSNASPTNSQSAQMNKWKSALKGKTEKNLFMQKKLWRRQKWILSPSINSFSLSLSFSFYQMANVWNQRSNKSSFPFLQCCIQSARPFRLTQSQEIHLFCIQEREADEKYFAYKKTNCQKKRAWWS